MGSDRRAIRCTRVFDGSVLVPEGGVVVLEGARILRLEPYRFSPPTDLPTLEVEGTLIPGLIDAHVHLCGDSRDGALDRLETLPDDALPTIISAALRRQLSAGVTTVRDLGDRRFAVTDWVREVDAGQRPGVLSAGPPLTSPRGHCWNMGGEVSGAEAIRAAVAERAERGVDLVKIMLSGGFMTPGTSVMSGQFSDEELRAAVGEAHRRGLPITAHAHAASAIEQAVASGVDGIEHCTFMTDHGPALTEAALSRLVSSGITVCPTLGQTKLVTPPPQMEAMLRALGLTAAGLMQTANRAAVRMYHAGVPLISGSDGGIGEAKPHGMLALSVAALVDAGLGVADAVSTATARAAVACGLAQRKGRIAPGYEADLVLLDGDLGSDVTALARVRSVWLGGRAVAI